MGYEIDFLPVGDGSKSGDAIALFATETSMAHGRNRPSSSSMAASLTTARASEAIFRSTTKTLT